MSNVPLAPLGRPVTGKRLGHVMEHHNWSKWRRKYPNVGAYLKANPGPLGEFHVDQWWLEHYRAWLADAKASLWGHAASCVPGRNPAEKLEWIERVEKTLPVPA
jgi:hypothetical protein